MKVLNPGDLDLVLEPGDVVASIKAEKIPHGPEALSYTQVGRSWAGLRIRIRIRSGFNRVSGSGFRIRILIQEGLNDPQKYEKNL